MEGFLSTKQAIKEKKDIFGYTVPRFVKPTQRNKRMKKAGFDIDEENDVYIKEGYGAYRENVEPHINSVEELRNYELHSKDAPNIHLKDTYQEIFKLIDEEGYEFVLGPGAPGEDGTVYGKGLYCKNYKEIIKRRKEEKQVKMQKEVDEERE